MSRSFLYGLMESKRFNSRVFYMLCLVFKFLLQKGHSERRHSLYREGSFPFISFSFSSFLSSSFIQNWGLYVWTKFLYIVEKGPLGCMLCMHLSNCGWSRRFYDKYDRMNHQFEYITIHFLPLDKNPDISDQSRAKSIPLECTPLLATL